MLRVVLAVLFATALLAVALPVVEDARVARTSDLVEGELARFGERAVGLATTGETGPDDPPRRVVTLALPTGGIAAASVDYVAIGGVPECGSARDTAVGDVVAYRTAGGATRVAALPVDVRAVTDGQVREDEDPLVVRSDARLTLTLVDRGGRRTVLVRRGTAGDHPTTAQAWSGRRA